MGDIRLVAPRVAVVREGQDNLEVQCDNRDLVLWDRTRLRHKWPSFQDAPFTWLTFISWAAARRTGAIPTELTYERWEADVLAVRDVGQDDTTEQDGELGRPTLPGPDPG